MLNNVALGLQSFLEGQKETESLCRLISGVNVFTSSASASTKAVYMEKIFRIAREVINIKRLLIT